MPQYCTKPSAIVVALLVACAVALNPSPGAHPTLDAATFAAEGLTESARLSAVYEAILAARDAEAGQAGWGLCMAAPGSLVVVTS